MYKYKFYYYIHVPIADICDVVAAYKYICMPTYIYKGVAHLDVARRVYVIKVGLCTYSCDASST